MAIGKIMLHALLGDRLIFGWSMEDSVSCAQGIALSADPNYKVLGSAYPWIAQRLLSDKSPELQETLRALLYKGSKFQFGRLESLLRQAVKAPPRAATIAGSGKRAASPGEQQSL